MKRLILRYVDVEMFGNNRQAVVKLELAGSFFEGRCQLANKELLFETVAVATLNAVNAALYSHIHAKVDFQLHHAQELRPQFLDNSLFVVVADAGFGHLLINLVGTVIADSQDWARATASAALDSTNRLVQHLLELESSI